MKKKWMGKIHTNFTTLWNRREKEQESGGGTFWFLKNEGARVGYEVSLTSVFDLGGKTKRKGILENIFNTFRMKRNVLFSTFDLKTTYC